MELQESSVNKQLGLGIIGGFIIVGIMAAISPWIYGSAGGVGPGDPYGFLRTIFETAGPSFIKATLGLIILLRLEHGLEGSWIGRIYNAPYGSTILFVVFLYCALR